MNRTYALVWNPSLATWNVTDERARRRGKGAGAVLAATLLLPVAAIAADLPTGGNVVAGSGQINTPSANQMVINQASNKLAIDWQSFDIAAGHKVTFNQPGSDSIALNRVLGADGSKIMGQLDANGRVFLINPNGVLFGTGAQVNVGGLVASTLNISDSDFAAGNYRFKGDGSNASVINNGQITAADGGSVALLGGTVSNNGVIVANQGTVALAAGNAVTLDFAGDGLLKVQVDEAVVDALVENHKLIKADGGQVLLTASASDALLKTVVNNTGVIEAQTLGEKNGKIVLEAGATNTVTNSGMLNASGVSSGETGGTVKVLGGAVKLLATSAIDVSGDAGGGTALIGGNFLGTGPEQNAKTTTVEAGASIKADAITAGKGGSVAVWSDGSTQFNGSITARGGSTSGNGGQVETSGKNLNINASAAVNTAAPHGVAGDWLLDPDDITIGNLSIWGNSKGINVDTITLTNALNNGNVTIKTTRTAANCPGTTCTGTSGNGDIIVLDTIGIATDYNAGNRVTEWTSNNTLTLSAYRHIDFRYTPNVTYGGGTQDLGGSIASNSGSGNVVLRADNTATGTGTVKFGPDQPFIWLNSGNVSVYYNPDSYSSPTDYSTYIWSPFNAYMAINVTGTAATKVYDGLTTTSISGLTSQLSMPGGLTLDTSSAVGTFADKNVGTDKTVTITGVTATGSGATTGTNSDGATVVSYGSNNYYINGLDSKTATITAKTISATGVTASNKTYDGTTTATLSGSGNIASSIVNGDSVSLSGGTGTFADANAGVGKAVTVTGFNLSGTDAGNYILTQPTGLTATINKANLTLSGTKTYDGSTAVAGNTLTATGVAGQTFTVSGAGDASNLNSKNVQTGSVLGSATGLSLGTSSNGGLASNYNVLGTSGSSYAVTAKGITLTGITASDKTYDATTAATLNTSNVAYSGIVYGDTVSLGGSGTGSFATKGVGINKSVTVSGYSLSGADAGNYVVTQPTGLTASISKADLVVSGVSGVNKTYDATTTATLSGSASVSALQSDVVSVVGTGSGSFADANAGIGKNITVTGYTLTGTDANNYNVVQPTNLAATINKADLTLSGTKVYDGTTSVAGSTLTATGVAGQTFTVTGSGDATNLASKNVQTGSTLSSAAGLSLGTSSNGGLNSNYNVLGTSGSSYAVTAKGITLTGITSSDKTYDATTSAALNTTNVAYSGMINGDSVALGGSGSGSFATKDVGTNKTVTVSGYSLSGADAGNYVVTQPTGLTASITKADLVVSGISGVNKTYDATTTATLAGSASVSALLSDVVSVVGTGSGSFADANAGIGKNITVTGYTLTGTDANNYNVVQPTNLAATINKADLTLSGTKVYDGTTSVAGSTLTATGVAGQTFTVTGSGDATNLASKNVQTGSTLSSAAGLSLGTSSNGGLNSNYNVLGTSGSSYAVTAKGITLMGITASDKTYDATTSAALNTMNVAYSGMINGDDVSLGGSGTGSFATKDVGINKSVTVSGYSLSGADAANYAVTQPTGLTASITKADLSLTGLTTTNKVYDATTTATLSGIAGLAATIGSDVVSLSGTGAGNFADKNVGTNKAVIVSGYTLSGTDANNYRIVQPVGLTADISKAALTLTANDASKVAGQSIALSGYTASGLLGADSISTVSLSSLGQPTTATAGSYAIVASNAVGAALSNYNINYQDGTLLVSPAAITPATSITASSQPYISVLASNGQSVLTPAKQQDNEPKALNQNMLVTNPLNVGLNLRVISDGIRMPEGI